MLGKLCRLEKHYGLGKAIAAASTLRRPECDSNADKPMSEKCTPQWEAARAVMIRNNVPSRRAAKRQHGYGGKTVVLVTAGIHCFAAVTEQTGCQLTAPAGTFVAVVQIKEDLADIAAMARMASSDFATIDG